MLPAIELISPTSTDDVTKIVTELSDWLLEGGPVSGHRAPFNAAFKSKRKYYEWLEEPGNEKRLQRFGHAMTGTGYWELAENIKHGQDQPPPLRPDDDG